MHRSKYLWSVPHFIFLAICTLPILALISLSITASWRFPSLLPDVLSWRYLRSVFIYNHMTGIALLNSTIIALCTTLFTLLLSVPAAKALALYNFRGREAVKLLALLPLMVPGITITMGLHFTLIRLGLAGTLVGVVVVHTIFSLPYAVRILTNVYELVGESQELQATLLGASWHYTLKTVTLPLLLPGLISASTISFIVSFTQYISTFMIGGGQIITLPLLLVPHVQSGEIQVASVYSLLFIGTTLAALFIMEGSIRRYYKATFFLQA